jgi:hypothetical protein
MATKTTDVKRPRLVDKKWLREKLAEQDARTGFELDRAATPQKARAMMLRDGVHPEDNALSREVIRLRYEGEGD